MWAILKIDRKKFSVLKKDLKDKLGADTIFYNPKLLIQKYKNNKLIKKELNLLGDYLFCFHTDLNNAKTKSQLKFVRGLKYLLDGFIHSQNEIKDFIYTCKNSENAGYLSTNFLNLDKNKQYKFASGPFVDTIFKIINLQKNKIDILMGNFKTTINKKKFLITSV